MISLLATLLLAAADGGPEALIESSPAVLGTIPAMPADFDAGVPVEAPPPPPAPVEQPAPPADVPLAAQQAPVASPPPVGEPIAPAFVKGELSVYLGSDRLVVKNNRVAVSAGLDRFAQAFYLLVEPQVDLRFLDNKLGIGLGVPLRIELFNFAADGQNGTIGGKRLGRIRTEDYDSFHDFGRVLKYVTYGRKEDPLYINVGQRYATSIGHGALVRRYAPNLDIDYPRVSAEVDAYNKYGGFELFTNDVLEWNLISGIGFVKPLAFINDTNLITRTLSIGASFGLDRNAPKTLAADSLGVRQVVDGRLKADSAPVVLMGFDAEVKVVKTDNIDIKPYVDYSLLFGGDGGLTLGALGRFNVGTDIVHAFRVVAELRYLGSRYAPSYFDSFYEVERFIYDYFSATRNSNGFFQYNPKATYLKERGLGDRAGYYFEVSYGIRGALGLTFALEGTTNAPEKNFVAHLEVPVLSFLQLFGSYYKRSFVGFGELFNADEKSVAFAGARLKVLPFLFLNGRLYKTFRVNPETQRYDNQFGFAVDAEIGLEFGEKKDKPKEEAAVINPVPEGATPASEAPVPPVEPPPAQPIDSTPAPIPAQPPAT